MSYTEQIAQAASAVEEAWDFTHDGDMVGVRRALSHARAVLAAMEREPLEDVLGDALVIAHTVMPANGLGTRIVVSVKQAGRNYRYGTGDTIDEAIRNAAAAAKGEPS